MIGFYWFIKLCSRGILHGADAMRHVKRIGGVFLNLGIFALLLLGPAGTVGWPRAWVLLGVIFVAGTLSVYAIPDDLLDERYKGPWQNGQPVVDKIILSAFMVSFFATVILIPLDVFRFHILPRPEMLVALVGLVLFAAGWWILARALVENAYAAPVVKLQKEREQHVIDTGPYRIVRHPMYSGFVPLLVGMALWLGSYASAILAIVPIALLAVRILFEERFLRRELAGYAEYMTRTRFRLVPFVW
jgi:protein-S-isoprenylcysteine O-methyltransferase Ste14